MISLELMIYYKDLAICRFYEWDDIRTQKEGLTVFHSDGQSTAFMGRHYTFKIQAVTACEAQ